MAPHTYTHTSPSWGLQGFLSPSQLDALLSHTTLRVTATLRHAVGDAGFGGANPQALPTATPITGSGATTSANNSSNTTTPNSTSHNPGAAGPKGATAADGDGMPGLVPDSSSSSSREHPLLALRPAGAAAGSTGGGGSSVVMGGPYRPLKVMLCLAVQLTAAGWLDEVPSGSYRNLEVVLRVVPA